MCDIHPTNPKNTTLVLVGRAQWLLGAQWGAKVKLHRRQCWFWPRGDRVLAARLARSTWTPFRWMGWGDEVQMSGSNQMSEEIGRSQVLPILSYSKQPFSITFVHLCIMHIFRSYHSTWKVSCNPGKEKSASSCLGCLLDLQDPNLGWEAFVKPLAAEPTTRPLRLYMPRRGSLTNLSALPQHLSLHVPSSRWVALPFLP